MKNIIVGTLIGILFVGLYSKTYEWIKHYGDFATVSFVQEAQARCYENTDAKIDRHATREEARLIRIENKIDKVLLR